MPSPATRSGRLVKGKRALDEKEKESSKDAGNKKTLKASSSPTRAGKSVGNKAPGSSQEPKEVDMKGKKSKQSAKQVEVGKRTSTRYTTETSDQGDKKVALEAEIKSPDISVKNDKEKLDSEKKSVNWPPPSMSKPRRSSRAPVPSSRFKDMEVGTTPHSNKMKRSFGASPSGDSDTVTEPSPKKIKKCSSKLAEVLPTHVAEKESPVLPHEDEKKDLSLDCKTNEIEECEGKDIIEQSVSTPIEEQKNKFSEGEKETTQEETDMLVLEPASLKSASDMILQSHLDSHNSIEGTEHKTNETEVSMTDESEVFSNQESMKVTTVNELNEELPLGTVEDQSKGSDQNAFLTSELSVNSTGDVVEGTPQEISVEEVGLSCNDAGIIVEETVHTYMDEKDVVVIQNPDLTDDQDATEETVNIHTQKGVELSLDKESGEVISSNIMIKGQEVTLQERDGKMVAIVKIPANFGSHFTSSPSTETKVVQSEKLTQHEDIATSSVTNITVDAAPSQKNRHGYILSKRTEKQSLFTISDQDQNPLNISVEPASISSILKPKPELPVKAASKSLYGRVIKQESVVGKPSAEASPLIQNPSSANLIIKTASSNQKISLLSHSIKATNPKDSKPYSLLSSPSELLQKLKAEGEKKQPPKVTQESKKATQLPTSSSPKKVVIITHPPKFDSKTERSSIAAFNPTPSTGSNVTSVECEMKSSLEAVQEEPLQISTTQVVEEIASVNEFTSDSNKVEEIVPSILHDGENTEVLQVESQASDDISKVKDEQNETSGAKDEDKTKELLIESQETFLEQGESGDVTSDLLISEDKAATEETVITSSDQTEVQVKQELELGTEDASEDKSIDILAVGEKEKSGTGTPKTQKIKLVDNGVVYELQIVSEGNGKSFQGDALDLEAIEGEDGMIVKQEIMDDEESASNEAVGKSSLGTQTIYTSKRGRPRVSGDKEDSDAPVHKLATIVQEGGQKKHYYYVSVVPGKTMDGKYRRSVDHSLPGCVVNDLGEYCCKECEYKTDKKANFYKHRRLHTGSKPHVCQVCKYQARTSSNLKRHMGIHEDIREFKCNQCSLSFRQKIHLERHIRYRHEEKRVKCPMCDYVCANEQPDLKMHIKRKHTQESGKVFTCPQCNIEVSSKRDLKQHLKFHKDGPELKLFCKECSFVTDCKSRLQRHLVVHSNVKPYHCGVCDYKATQKEHVVRHLRSQHKIEVNKPKRPWKKHMKHEASETLGGNSRGDFTCGDKIFACNHCTMRFAKLINLYKHLHTQHSDIMPAESDSNYYCVVCEFSTSSKKNLLVHMRRHNMTDQTPPTHVYSCVLCRYVNPRRRNLFQHMRKKHNIDISTQVDIAGMTEEEEAAVRQDGDKMAEFIQTEPGVFTQANTEEMAASNFDNPDGSTQVMKDNLAGVANMIKIEDLTRGVPSGADGKEATSLIIDNSDGTQVIHTTSLMQHKAADAIEGLQALAGQAGLIIDEEQVSTLDKQPRIVIEQAEGEVINTTDGTLADGSIILSTEQTVVGEQVAIDEASSEQIQHIVESVESSDANSGLTSLELTEEQLSSLHHGDIVQMEGQVYMVEIAQDPDSPDKQLLSFLPINQE